MTMWPHGHADAEYCISIAHRADIRMIRLHHRSLDFDYGVSVSLRPLFCLAIV